LATGDNKANVINEQNYCIINYITLHYIALEVLTSALEVLTITALYKFTYLLTTY